MKTSTKYLNFKTNQKREIINITNDVDDFLNESQIKEGMILVSAMHITAGVFINDNEMGFFKDFEEWMQKLAPDGPNYNHHRTGEVNGDAHLKNILVGHQVIVPVTNGRLDLGPWQQIFYAEFDGRRSKRLVLKALGI